MNKNITFGESDKELVERIIKFQKENDLSSFVAAVRTLCNEALELKEFTKKSKILK